MSNLSVKEESIFARFDVWSLLVILALTVISIFAVYSSGVDSEGFSHSSEWIKQIFWIISGFILYVVFSLINYTRLRDFSFAIYLGCLLLLILVLVAGSVINGARSWLGFGPFGIQPAEFAKIAAVLTMATYLDGQPTRAEKFGQVAVSGVLLMPLVLLILLQPDAGSASVFLATFFIVVFFAGAKIDFVLFVVLSVTLTVSYILIAIWDKYIAVRNIWFANILTEKTTLLQLLLATLFVFFVAGASYFRTKKSSYYVLAFLSLINSIALSIAYLARLVLKPYQEMRLATFLEPNLDPQGSGYQVLQSLTAVGSGGIVGKGYLKGTHSHLRYLPEQSTDFIFSIISEETGFLGGMVIIGLFTILLIRILYAASRSADRFGSYICTGVFAIILFHLCVNMGMVIGLVPITGIPLLLVSYGGSSMWMIMSLLGMVNSIYIRRYRD